MAKRAQHSFMKRQKEINRKQKAQAKMARRQGKKKEPADIDSEHAGKRPDEQEQERA